MTPLWSGLHHTMQLQVWGWVALQRQLLPGLMLRSCNLTKTVMFFTALQYYYFQVRSASRLHFMLTNIMYFNSLSHILLNKLSLNSRGQNPDSAWSKIMYDLIPRSIKSQKLGENYQESDFHGRHLEKWPPLLSGILLCINRADSFYQYDFVNNRNQKIGHEPHWMPFLALPDP